MAGNFQYLNCNGTKKKWVELSNFVFKNDITCFSETKLIPNDFLSDVNGFLKVRKDRKECTKETGGGLVAFIRRGIQYESIVCKKAPKNVEYILLKISKDVSCFYLFFGYNPPIISLTREVLSLYGMILYPWVGLL